VPIGADQLPSDKPTLPPWQPKSKNNLTFLRCLELRALNNTKLKRVINAPIGANQLSTDKPTLLP